MTVTKRELVIQIANKLGMTQSDVASIVDETFDALARNLAAGNRWELRDFGVFEVKTRASRIGRNPRTGDQVPVPERRVATFRPGKEMRERVAGKVAAPLPASTPPTSQTDARPASHVEPSPQQGGSGQPGELF